MSSYLNFESFDLFNEVFIDAEVEYADEDLIITRIDYPQIKELNEYQYYVKKVGFFFRSTISWFRQLQVAVDLISNFDYSQKTEATRADHLVYNIENYLIRLTSIYDRILQLTNAVFNLGISDDQVNPGIIINNYKVQNNSEIYKSIKSVKNLIKKYIPIRNKLTHRHNLLDDHLNIIENIYSFDSSLYFDIEDEEINKIIKKGRSQHIRNYIKKKKPEFSKINNQLYEEIGRLFEYLIIVYKKNKSLIENSQEK